MMKHLIELGHERIGIIGVPDIVERLTGVQIAAKEHGIDVEQLPYEVGNFSEDSGANAAEKLICEYPDLTAFVVFNDRMAMGAINKLQSMGYHVPDQISVVGYDDLPRSRDFSPPLTTVNHQLNEWGGLAMSMLHNLIRGDEPDPIILKPELIIRGSTAPRPN